MRVRVAVAASLIAAAAPLGAQPADADSTEAVALPPLEVRILRTSRQLERVPYAVAARSTREIQLGRPGLSVEEALRGLPGVQVENRYNYALGERISIRGFGARAQFGVKGIRILVDGLPATLPDGQSSLTHVDVKSLGRVEVMRGPAAALYGNTAGGVIQMESEMPGADALTQELAMTAGSGGLLRAQSTTSGRAGGVFHQIGLTRLAFDGYREHSRARNLYLNARVGLDRGIDQFRVVVSVANSDALNPGSLSEAQQAEDRFQAHAGNVNQKTGKTVREGMFGATWQRASALGDLEVAAYAGMRDVRNPIPSDVIEFERAGVGGRAVFRSRPTGPLALQWAVGAEADRQRDDRRNFANTGGRNGELRLDQLEHVHNLGVLGQLSVSPLPRITLTGALRYDWFRFEADDRFVTAEDPDDSGGRTMDAVSPSVGATFTVSDGLQLYGNVGTSFETPTTTELANRPDRAGGFNADLEPQRALSMELGARGQVLDVAAYQVALYRVRIENALVPFEVPEAPSRQYFRNAGSAVHQGVELGMTVEPAAFLALRGAYAYTQATFDEYAVDGTSFAGNAVPGVSPHRFDLTATVQSAAASGWYAAVENRFVSRLAVNDANTAYSPSYTVTDVRAGIEGWEHGALSISPFIGVSNVFAVEHNTSVTVNAFGNRYFESGPGRSYYLGGSAKIAAR